MTNNKQQTAVQEHITWLKEQLQQCIDDGYSSSWIYAYKLAIGNAELMLDVEKKQIKEAVWRNLPIEDGVTTAVQKADQYYNKTYGYGKQQTTLQILINGLIDRKENIIENADSMPNDMLEGGVMAFESAIDLAQYLLDMEKKQIILSIAKNLPIEYALQKAELYYNKTYGNDKQ